ncbi:hypothetical protein HY988_07280 [Candidatus Micrarchaeota archaeon]|nr:hypothetical protein [Candidatus Micrarchaeota archaeon]
MANIRLNSPVPLGYEKDAWGVERISLDGPQNHLPGDSGGTYAKITFYNGDRAFDLRGVRKQDGPFTKIVIEDDGRGYHYKLLGKLASFRGMNACVAPLSTNPITICALSPSRTTGIFGTKKEPSS